MSRPPKGVGTRERQIVSRKFFIALARENLLVASCFQEAFEDQRGSLGRARNASAGRKRLLQWRCTSLDQTFTAGCILNTLSEVQNGNHG
jgi:hypothetical protein